MAQPWQTIDSVDTPDGILELRKRGERDFLITIGGRVLMNSSASRSEIALGELACHAMASLKEPRILIGGLGMGITLRAALDALPAHARVIVAEINPAIAAWCRGPLAGLTNYVVNDPRVSVEIRDVSALIAQTSEASATKFDAIIIDLFEGPHPATHAKNDPFYGSRALARTRAALSTGGVFAVWGENSDAKFEKRLEAAGFSFERLRPGKGGLRHVVYLAKAKKSIERVVRR